MKVHDLMSQDGRVFLKSEYGPISDYWPCLSFAKKSVGTRLNSFHPGHDILIYVGTLNRDATEDPAHRGRLLSAVIIQLGQIIPTKDIIPPASWAESVRVWESAGRLTRWPSPAPPSCPGNLSPTRA